MLNKDYRSSHQRCSVRKCVLRNLAKFTRKHLCHSLFFNEVAGLRPATSLKKRLWHRCFPLNFAKFLRTPFLQNKSGRLLLRLLFWSFILIQMRVKFTHLFMIKGIPTTSTMWDFRIKVALQDQKCFLQPLVWRAFIAKTF